MGEEGTKSARQSDHSAAHSILFTLHQSNGDSLSVGRVEITI